MISAHQDFTLIKLTLRAPVVFVTATIAYLKFTVVEVAIALIYALMIMSCAWGP